MQFNFPTKPFEDKEQDLYSYSLIRQEMDAADTETGNQPGDIVGGSLQPFDDARSKKIMAFANELERGGLAHIKKMDGESVDFVVLRDSAFPKIDYLVQKYGLLPTDQAKQTKQQRQKQDQEKTQEFQRQNQLAAQQQLGIGPTKMQQQQQQQQGGGMAAMMQQMMGGGGGQPQQQGGGMGAMMQQMMGGGGGQPQQQKINPQDPTARDQDPRSQGMLAMQNKMVQGGLTPVKRPDAKGLGLQKQTEVPRFEATIIFRGPYHLKGDEIIKDVRNQFKMMFGGASNKADGTFTMDLSFHDQETANDVLGYIQKRHGSEIIDIITSRLNTNIPGYGRYKQTQQAMGQQMGRFDPRSAIGEEHTRRLRVFEEAMRNTGRGLRLRYPDEEEASDPDNPFDFPDYNTDSDGDGVPDWYEIAMGTDPNDDNDTPEIPTLPEPGDDPFPPDFVPGYDPLTYPDFFRGGSSPGPPKFPDLLPGEERGIIDQYIFNIIFIMLQMGLIVWVPGAGLKLAGGLSNVRLGGLIKRLIRLLQGGLEAMDFIEIMKLLRELYKLVGEENPLDAPQDPDLSKEPKLPTLTKNPIELPSDTPPPTQPFGPGGNNPLP